LEKKMQMGIEHTQKITRLTKNLLKKLLENGGK
jgi:hypothetical protein